VPTFTPIDTKKVSFRCAAVVDATMSGETKILWMPHAGCVNDVDAFRVVNGTVSVGTNRTNSPFTASRIGDSLRARLVSARMTVCGVSAENDGIIVAGASLIEDASQYTIADIVSRIREKHLAVGRTVQDMVHLNYVPRDADEREAFVDDVNEGVFGGARTITSTAYPARHVVAWKGQGVSQQLQVTIDCNWELIGDDVKNIRETTTPALVRPVRQSTLNDAFVSPLSVAKGGGRRIDDSAFAPRRRFVDTPGEM